jgi:hypothetical protein
MAIDTHLKRYSAINVGSPWRGPNIAPDALFPQGERQAAAFMYSGILASGFTPVVSGSGKQFIGEIQQISIDAIMNASMGQG